MILFTPAVATDCQAQKYEKILFRFVGKRKMQ